MTDSKANRSQYLTAVVELLPTRRKAAALERVRAAAEGLFWDIVSGQKTRADAVSEIADKKERRTAWREMESSISRSTIAAAVKIGVAEPVAQGLVRDISMAIGSYVELRAGGHNAEWPAVVDDDVPDYDGALEMFASATTRQHENSARDVLTSTVHVRGPRPMTIARARDAQLVRTDVNGKIAAVLNVIRASDKNARTATVCAGIDAASGEVMAAKSSKTRIIVPVACSKWHEQKFLSGRAILRSSLIRRVGDRWFMSAQFEFSVKEIRPTGARLGVDRGIVNPIALAVVNRNGAVHAASEPDGAEIGRIIKLADDRRKKEQKRRGTTSHTNADSVNNQLHILANKIVDEAKQYGAQVVLENLDGLKQTIVATRARGSRKGGWRRTLKRAQLGKLEVMLDYKLRMAGLPVVRSVAAGGTSITCPACATRDPKNRQLQAEFKCVACGFTSHADSVGAVNIARRGVAMEKIIKGAKLASIEQDMVARLWLRDDNGLGPLVAEDIAADGLVAARASDDSAYDPFLLGLTVSLGQNANPNVTQNGRNVVFAARGGAFSKNTRGQKVQLSLDLVV